VDEKRLEPRMIERGWERSEKDGMEKRRVYRMA
jgi:hypothetical protein